MTPAVWTLPQPAARSLEALSTAVMLLDVERRVTWLNPATENLFQASRNHLVGHPIDQLVQDGGAIANAIDHTLVDNAAYTQHDFVASVPGGAQRLLLSCTATTLEHDEGFLLEFVPRQQQSRLAREERLQEQSEANRELIRNLAHEIKNPLGALRGAAQLLDRELERPELHEYTQVIMKEADRLQSLMDRLLTPHRLPKPIALNIHEVTERVRSLLVAEYPDVRVRRDYDTSLPPLIGDREQLIQVVLNVARNGAQAMQGHGAIALRTRVARRVTIAKRLYGLAIALEVVDDGPGIPDELRERIFLPLVSGREGGTGLGLTLAQTFVSQHGGLIEVESQPGRTSFLILLPLKDTVVTPAVAAAGPPLASPSPRTPHP
ncbi:MAG: ATP-binding protein [Burkholderiales bacterium]|nr:ATP-binding protein [Burkholderiales bacterium]